MVWQERFALACQQCCSLASRRANGCNLYHMFDIAVKDWFAVVSILENLLLTLKMENPSLSKGFIR